MTFGDGRGAQVCLPGQAVAVAYTTTGRKNLSFTFLYANGQRFTTRSELYVKRVPCTGCRSTLLNADGTPCRTVPLMATRAFQGYFGKADISYYYSTSKTCDVNTAVNVTKPVIVIDGFDHDDERKAFEIFNENLAYKNGNQSSNLGAELANAGYDVVIMNMPNVYRTVTTNTRPGTTNTYQSFERHGGSDYIERNGLALVSLIEELNAQLRAAGSTEQLVVVGPSMGGQVARYALAYMERNNLVHNTRLYIALDSPHNGANIPIGLQRFVRHYADLTGDGKLVTNLEKINSPASGEMTLQHYNFNDNNETVTTFTPHPWRTNFINNLNALRPGGFPSNVRRVAVTNGALNGGAQRDQNGQVVRDSDQALFLQLRGVPGSIWGLFTRVITTASARINFSPGLSATAQVLRTYKLGTGERFYDAVGPVNSCGIDASPGGYKSFFYEVANDNSFNRALYSQTFYSVRDRACFIPMLSALGCTYPGYNNCSGVDTRYLVCNNGTPFDAYYGPATVNEEHTQLTSGNVTFLRNEIYKITSKPTLAAAPPAELCSAGSAVHPVVAVLAECLLPGRNQPGTFYEWTAEEGIQFVGGTTNVAGISSATGASVRLIATPGLNSQVLVSVRGTRAGYVPSDQTSFSVRVVPTSTFTLDYVAPNGYPQNDWVPAAENVAFALRTEAYDLSSIRWQVNGVAVSTSIGVSTAGRASVVFNVGTQSVCTVTATAIDLCDGLSKSSSKSVRIGTGPNFPNNRLAPTGAVLLTYPNPVREAVSIVVEEPASLSKTTATPATADVQLYDAYGHLVRHRQASGLSFTLDTHSLPAGLYNLVVVRGAEVLRKHVEIGN